MRSYLAESALAFAVWTGFAAAMLSCLLTISLALLLWIPDADATATSSSVVHAGVITFLLALHGGARVNGVQVGFVPLGMTAAAVAACWRLGRSLWSHPAAAADRTAALVAAQVAAYAATCVALAPSARLGTTSVAWTGALLGAVGVAVVGFGGCALRAGRIHLRPLPTVLTGAARAGAAASAVFVAGGAALAAATTLAQHDRFFDLSRALARGISGLPVALIDACAAPNAVIASVGYLAGPGFSVGSAHYSLRGNTPGNVPAFPVLSGLPAGTGSAAGSVVVLAAVTVLAAGVLAGWSVSRDARIAGWRAGLAASAASGLVAGVLLGAASVLAGGRLGTHSLRTVGAPPLLVLFCVTLEVGLTAGLTQLGLGLYRYMHRHDQHPLSVPTEGAIVSTDDAGAGDADASAAAADTVELPAVRHVERVTAVEAVEPVVPAAAAAPDAVAS